MAGRVDPVADEDPAALVGGRGVEAGVWKRAELLELCTDLSRGVCQRVIPDRPQHLPDARVVDLLPVLGAETLERVVELLVGWPVLVSHFFLLLDVPKKLACRWIGGSGLEILTIDPAPPARPPPGCCSALPALSRALEDRRFPICATHDGLGAPGSKRPPLLAGY